MQPRRRAASRSSGFTLIELLTVVIIMLILMSLAVGGFYGMTRGMGLRSAVNGVRGMVLLARQHAVTQQARTIVTFEQDDRGSSFIVLMRFATCANGGAGFVTVTQDMPWGNDELEGGTIYNTRTGESGTISGNDALTINANVPGGWMPGDGIAFAVHDREYLPPGLVFNSGDTDDVPDPIEFYPDGSTGRTQNPGAGDYEIEINESGPSGGGAFTLTVNRMTGWINES